MKKYLRYLGPIVVTCIFLGAMYLLYHKLKAYSLVEIQASVKQIPHWRLWASVGLMIVNYIILVFYDWLALIAINKPLPIRQAALVSFIGQAVSYNFGALLGGTTVRYRFYSAWNFSLQEIVRLVLMLAVAFWVGALGLCGLFFIIAPPDIPAELLAHMPIKDIRILGVLLLSITVVYLILCHFVRNPLHVFGKEFTFPTFKIAVLQTIVACVDLIAAAGCMYVLLPGDLDVSFWSFLPSYLMAQVAVVLTHVPGGVGVFELVILHLTHTPREEVVVAAVLCFRIIYFILPLLAAILFLGIYEARVRKDALRDAGRWLSVLSHSICAWASFSAGVLLLCSSLLPPWNTAFSNLFIYAPTWFMYMTHWLSLFSGVALLFIAYGLERRQAIAWQLAVSFLVLGFICEALCGVHFFLAGVLLIVFLTIVMARRHFYRKSFFWLEIFPLRWLWPTWLVLLCYVSFVYMRHNNATVFTWEWCAHLGNFANVNIILSVYGVLLAVWLWRAVRRMLYKRCK